MNVMRKWRQNKHALENKPQTSCTTTNTRQFLLRHSHKQKEKYISKKKKYGNKEVAWKKLSSSRNDFLLENVNSTRAIILGAKTN